MGRKIPVKIHRLYTHYDSARIVICAELLQTVRRKLADIWEIPVQFFVRSLPCLYNVILGSFATKTGGRDIIGSQTLREYARPVLPPWKTDPLRPGASLTCITVFSLDMESTFSWVPPRSATVRELRNRRSSEWQASRNLYFLWYLRSRRVKVGLFFWHGENSDLPFRG